MAGFDARASTVSFSRWLSDLARGHFTGSVLASASGPSPFYMYENWLDPALVVHGRANGGNYEQFDAVTDPAGAALVSAELDAFTDNPSDSAAAQSAVEKLADVVTQQAPVLPLMYGVAWAEFSTRHATGWPNSQDPYEPGNPPRHPSPNTRCCNWRLARPSAARVRTGHEALHVPWAPGPGGTCAPALAFRATATRCEGVFWPTAQRSFRFF